MLIKSEGWKFENFGDMGANIEDKKVV